MEDKGSQEMWKTLQVEIDICPAASQEINCMKVELANDLNKHENKFSLRLTRMVDALILVECNYAGKLAEPHYTQTFDLQCCELICLCCLSHCL